MVLLEGEEGGVRNVTAFELFSYLRTPAPPRIGGETAENNVHRSSFNVPTSSARFVPLGQRAY